MEKLVPDLADLPVALVRIGFGEFVANFDPLRPRQINWLMHREKVPNHLKVLLDLFLLCREVGIPDLPDNLDWIPAVLVRYHLADVTEGRTLRLRHNMALLPILGRWLFCNPPGTGSKYYVGDDSLALMMRVMPSMGGTVLDLCAGSGLQSLHCAGWARQVTSVECDAEVAALARVNVLLNSLGDRVTAFQGDLFEPVLGQRFDMVIANPPLLPYPDALPDHPIGQGGSNGMHVTCRILKGLQAAMADRGHAQIVSACLTDRFNQGLYDLVSPIARNHGLDIKVSVLSMQDMTENGHSIQAVIRAVAEEISAELETVRQAYVDLLRQRNATHLSFLLLLVTHGNGAIDMTDMSVSGSADLWHVDPL
ncbi:methyltransferase [Rhizobium laguerreae]|uniref:methyltransferase n=1 Tax=Rhizobium laguerreae TaxID=1076926 RepID=UPI001C91080C|nr:methyltransferase [Rhizobium laguerreae]MBY3348427.1 methyltransferase [Rhizobium laguerreae]MBY3355983.1 methyltransferase [Rhizobium laguerreae]MBY3369192.1 methyltransferase [Rhizobium laguerreae]MBY3376581.1 methyltransferase [Rhizobium laguerreae]MBY3390826.1 methyltransferase [Rhizobium laguerreae]